jgi:hypothetical protein
LGYTLLSRTVDVLVLTCLILSAVTIVVFGRAARRLEPRRIGVRAVAVGTPIALGLTLAGGLLLTALTPWGWTALGSVLLGTAWWLVPFALVLRSAWRCWQAAGA